MPVGLDVPLAEDHDQGEVRHQRRDDVGHAVAHPVGGLGELGGDAEPHQHRHEDAREQRPLGRGRADEQVDDRGQQHDADHRHLGGQIEIAQEIGALERDQQADVGVVERGDELGGEEGHHQVVGHRPHGGGHARDDVAMGLDGAGDVAVHDPRNQEQEEDQGHHHAHQRGREAGQRAVRAAQRRSGRQGPPAPAAAVPRPAPRRRPRSRGGPGRSARPSAAFPPGRRRWASPAGAARSRGRSDTTRRR